MSSPKIVIWDLETLPNPREVYKRLPSYGAWHGRGFNADIQGIICFGFKILGKGKAKCFSRWDYPSWEIDYLDDKMVCQAAYEILHDADEIVTHNGIGFDLPILNTRLTFHGLTPLPNIHHVDTKKLAKSKLSLYSNSLKEVAKHFKCENKTQFVDKWDMWYRIAFQEQTKKDLKVMSDYCKQDVEVTHQIYEKMKPYHGTSGVNKNLFSSIKVCPVCGGTHLISNGWRRTQTVAYKRYQCQSCGAWSRTDKKDQKLRSI